VLYKNVKQGQKIGSRTLVNLEIGLDVDPVRDNQGSKELGFSTPLSELSS
jgi:hypothetical protein